MTTFGGHGKRCARARDLLAIVGGMAGLVGQYLDTVDIRSVAEQVGGGSDGGARLRRHLLRAAGTEPNDDETPAHGRASQPGTSTSEK